MLVEQILNKEYINFHKQQLYYTDGTRNGGNTIYTNLGIFSIEDENISFNKCEQVIMAKVYNKYRIDDKVSLFSNLEYLELHINETNSDLFSGVCELLKLNVLSLYICDTYYDNAISCELLCNLPNIKTLLIELVTYCEIKKYLNNLPTSLEAIIFITSYIDNQRGYIKQIMKNIKLPLGCNLYHLHRFSILSDEGLIFHEADITNNQ